MATKVNLQIDQASSFITSFTIFDDNDNPIDFTGYTVNSQCKKSYTSANNYPFVATASNTGLITLTMNYITSGSMAPGRYVYDIEVVDVNSIHSRLIEGIVTVNPAVTIV